MAIYIKDGLNADEIPAQSIITKKMVDFDKLKMILPHVKLYKHEPLNYGDTVIVMYWANGRLWGNVYAFEHDVRVRIETVNTSQPDVTTARVRIILPGDLFAEGDIELWDDRMLIKAVHGKDWSISITAAAKAVKANTDEIADINNAETGSTSIAPNQDGSSSTSDVKRLEETPAAEVHENI